MRNTPATGLQCSIQKLPLKSFPEAKSKSAVSVRVLVDSVRGGRTYSRSPLKISNGNADKICSCCSARWAARGKWCCSMRKRVSDESQVERYFRGPHYVWRAKLPRAHQSWLVRVGSSKVWNKKSNGAPRMSACVNGSTRTSRSKSPICVQRLVLEGRPVEL